MMQKKLEAGGMHLFALSVTIWLLPVSRQSFTTNVYKHQIGASPMVIVWCGIDSWPQSYKTYESFRSHIHQKHHHVLCFGADSAT